ncbi:MAG: response regulator [Mariprofundaceae bacterium]|nr:response regulator [Mariprofundaceae bacterium]
MSRPRLLIAEDDEALAALLDEYLSSAGYDITLCHRGDDALKALEQQHFDVVLSDIVMPGASGLEVLQACHEQPSRTVVLLMTAYSGIEDAIQAIEQGAYDFVSKPFQLPEIRVRLDNATRYQSLLRQWQDLQEAQHPESFVQFTISTSHPDPAAVRAYGMRGR